MNDQLLNAREVQMPEIRPWSSIMVTTITPVTKVPSARRSLRLSNRRDAAVSLGPKHVQARLELAAGGREMAQLSPLDTGFPRKGLSAISQVTVEQASTWEMLSSIQKFATSAH